MCDKILAGRALVAAKIACKTARKFNAKRRQLNLKTEIKFCKAGEAVSKIARARCAKSEPLKFPGVNFT